MWSEKAMATHSSTLAWKIPWTEKPGGLQSMGLIRVRHDWETSLSLFTFMHWRRKWQPIPVFLPGESQVRESLVVCHLWGSTESDMTEVTQQQQQQQQLRCDESLGPHRTGAGGWLLMLGPYSKQGDVSFPCSIWFLYSTHSSHSMWL